MFPAEISSRVECYSTPYYACSKHVVDFVGFKKTYYVVNFKKTAAIICINSRNEVLLTRQYRFLINRISLEIAGGGIDDSEDFAAGANRELLEETGYIANELVSLCKFRPGLDNVDNPTEIFLCRDFIKQHDIDLNPSEILGIQWVHIDECLRMISSFEIQDGTTIMGISLAKVFLENNT